MLNETLNAAPPRLQRMLLKLSMSDLDVRYVAGKEQVISDCLNRASITDNDLNSGVEEEIGRLTSLMI